MNQWLWKIIIKKIRPLKGWLLSWLIHYWISISESAVFIFYPVRIAFISTTIFKAFNELGREKMHLLVSHGKQCELCGPGVYTWRNCCKDLLLECSSSPIKSHPLEPDSLHTGHWAFISSAPSDPLPDIQSESEGKSHTSGVLFEGQVDLKIFIFSFTKIAVLQLLGSLRAPVLEFL